MTDHPAITLGTLSNGALPEMFESDLARVLANIANVNTPAKALREIVIRVRFKPDETRELSQITATCVARLAPNLPAVTQAFLGTQDGVLVAVEANPRQPGLFDERTGKVLSLANGRD